MIEMTTLAKFTDRDQAYFAYAENAQANHEHVMSLGRFDEFWRGLKGLPRPAIRKASHKTIIHAAPTPKENAIMAPTTNSKRTGRLTTPFLLDNPDEAWDAYKKMPFTKSPTARVMNKREFMKAYPDRHAKAIAKQGRTTNAPSTPTTPDVDWSQFDEDVLAQLRASGVPGIPEPEMDDEQDDADQGTPDPTIVTALANNPEALIAYLGQFSGTQTTTTATRSTAKRYRQRTNRADLPGEGNTYQADENIAPASNAVLWALNTEGLLSKAYERAEANGDVLDTDNADGVPYITQACGKDVLAEVFGPLPDRQTA